MAAVDVLIPTYERAGPLAVTLTSLVGQAFTDFRVVVSDQSRAPIEGASLSSAIGVLRALGREVDVLHHVPRRGVAENRQFLLDRATAPLVLFLDDDVVLEPDALGRLLDAIARAGCGFVGCFVNAPSAMCSTKPVDEPPPGVCIEFWDGPVVPEVVGPGLPGWERQRLHFAAYLHRLGARAGVTRAAPRLYKVAWVGGCVMFRAADLRAAGGFSFWEALPADHCGEDVLAQLRVMSRSGGAGLAPSAAWHQEVPTTLPNRAVDAPLVLGP